MKCPVCKTELNSNQKSCPNCAFNDIRTEFINTEEAVAWMDNVVVPYRTRFFENDNAFSIEQLFRFKLQETITQTANNDNNFYKGSDLFVVEKNESGVTIIAYCGNEPKVAIPEKFDNVSVTKIGPAVFKGNKNLQEIIIPGECASIEESAFENSSVCSVQLPPKIKKIGKAAFKSTRLRSVVIPDECDVIAESAFENSMLEEVHLPTCLKKLNKSVFRGTALTKITIPNDCAEIGPFAFYEAPLTSVLIPISCTKIGDQAFGKTKLSKIVLPKDLEHIGNHAFHLTPLTEISIPKKCSYIGEGAFSNTLITEIIVPQNVRKISRSMFENCKNLDSVIIMGASTLCSRAFGNCSKLRRLFMPNELKKIEPNAVDLNASNVKSIIFPLSLESINFDDFFGSTKGKTTERSLLCAFPNDNVIIKNMKKTYCSRIYCNIPSNAYRKAKELGIPVLPLSDFPVE